MAETERAWHAMPATEVAAAWETNVATGLLPDAVIERRARVGSNELPQPPKESWVKQLLAQLVNPLVGTLLAAAVVSVVVAMMEPGERSGLAKYSDAMAILLIVAASTKTQVAAASKQSMPRVA